MVQWLRICLPMQGTQVLSLVGENLEICTSNVSLSELQELVMDREAWRTEAHGVTKSRTREGNGTPPQYSCLENPMDGGAW